MPTTLTGDFVSFLKAIMSLFQGNSVSVPKVIVYFGAARLASFYAALFRGIGFEVLETHARKVLGRHGVGQRG